MKQHYELPVIYQLFVVNIDGHFTDIGQERQVVVLVLKQHKNNINNKKTCSECDNGTVG